MKKPVTVAITGTAGNIGYAIAFRIASGGLFGPEQPVNLHLIEIEPALPALEGVVMELHDCAFPTLNNVVATADLDTGFADADYVFLIGSRPRSKGMERQDLLLANGAIFKPQGAAIDRSASKDVRVLIVGNPANTNALITLHNAPNLAASQISSMMRLDHNRAINKLSRQLQVHPNVIKNMTVWGNHSTTQFPDLQHCIVDGKAAADLVDQEWYRTEYIYKIQHRGAQVIEARGASSAASAASAAIDHMRNWALGTAPSSWVSMGVMTDGSHYGVGKDLIFSFPCQCKNNRFEIVAGLELDDYSMSMIQASEKELIKERDMVLDLLH